jgi:cytoskeleton protein RodZ
MYVSFGRDLQLEREKLGVSLESLAEATKLSVRNLRALEEDNFTTLPGGVFQRGMVRNYCRILDLEEKEWLDRFATANPASAPEKDWMEFAENVRRTRISGGSGRGLRWWGVFAMFLVLALTGWATWRYIVRARLHSQVIQPISSADFLAT